MTNSKPTYLGLLNAIAVGEARGDKLFRAWSRATSNEALKPVLDFVGIREREHAAAFTKRLCELGFSVRDSAKGDFKKTLALAGSDASDKKKFEKILGISGSADGKDPFGEMFSDASIDPETGALLGRYIAEERDSGRRLRAAYETLRSPSGADPVLDDIATRLDRLTRTLEELKTMRT